ncbi:MAG: ABC transporter permease [Candidatus Aminicenantes bacterium]|nr:MAG: ABC transporter permease [Candidatus Aminicenantes bacterium]
MSKHDRPLKILEILLENIIPFEDQENLVGDFEEMFERISTQKGKTVAIIWYIFQICKLIPSYFRNYMYWSMTMIKNYLKITFRNIKKYKSFSFINIAGLAIGMACCVLIILFIQDELSFDRYHEKADRIYRLVDSFDVEGDMSRDFALSSAPFAPALKKEFSEVEDAVRLFPGRRRMVSYREKKYYENGLYFADPSLFEIFTFPLVQGNPDTALTAPNTIVISEFIATKYFGNHEPINRTLSINDQDYIVTGIMKYVPANSHFRADMFASLITLEQLPTVQERYFQNWARHEFYTYLLLRESSSADELQKKLPRFIEKYAAVQIKTILGGTLSPRLQPLKSIHLHSHLQAEISPNGDIKYVYIFSVIALFILLIACVNFMNLAAARSANRSKEVGLRKVVGANRGQLVKQFLGESMLLTFFSLILALLVVKIALPFFNALTSKDIALNDLVDVVLIGSILFILFFVGIVSGSYPAFFISRFQPANVLRSSASVGSGKSLLRKGLVILQFSVSIILIISTAIVLDQLDFLRNRKLGFEKEHVVVVTIRENAIRKNAETIKADLLQNPNILNATITIGVPGGIVAGDAIQLVTDEGKKTLTLRMIYTDHDYIKTMGIEIIQGRDFAKDMSTDATEAFIINEAAVRHLGLENPLNTRFDWGEKKGKVIGVVKDFQFQSLKEDINPLVIHVWPHNTYVFAMRIRPIDIPETLAFIEEKWRELDPAHPFEYSFMDESFDKLYRSEEKLSQIFSLFSLLAICIAALGLFGLALFMVEQRTKEIGIRKVLGASVGSIFLLVSKEFAYLVLIANMVAWPTAYFLMRKWLQNFAYRVNMEPWLFMLSGGIALSIAILTISYQAVKAAMADPVHSLKYE